MADTSEEVSRILRAEPIDMGARVAVPLETWVTEGDDNVRRAG